MAGGRKTGLRFVDMTAGAPSVLARQVLAADQSSQIWALKPL